MFESMCVCVGVFVSPGLPSGSFAVKSTVFLNRPPPEQIGLTLSWIISRHDRWSRKTFHYPANNVNYEILQTQHRRSVSLGLSTLSKAGDSPRVFGPSGYEKRVEKHQSEVLTANTSEWFVNTSVELCVTRFKNVCILLFYPHPFPPSLPSLQLDHRWPWRNNFSTHAASRWCWEKKTERNLDLALLIFRNTFKGKIQGAPLSVLPAKCRAWCRMNGCGVSAICSNYLRK